MNILPFLLVWLATWTLCWFGLARVWRSRIGPISIITPSGQRIVRRALCTFHPGPNGTIDMKWRDARWRLSGAREWAPLIATVAAFAVDALVGSLS